MTRHTRLLAALAGTATVATLLVVSAQSGSATGPGAVTFAPTTGADTTDITVTTAGPCPQGATNIIVKVTGGDPATASSQVTGGTIVGNTPISAFNTANGGMVIPLTQNFHDFALSEGFTPIKGTYVVTVTCRTNADPTSLGDYAGSLVWTPGASAFTGTYTVAPNTVSTSVALAVTPDGPVLQGTPVTLRATLTPSGAAGSVQFKDGAANVGAPVPVASGIAELVTSSLAPGTRSLTAVFTPTDPEAYGASTSSPVSYQVNAPAPAFLPTVFPAPRVGVPSTCVVSASNATSFAYQWFKNNVAISGATAVTRVVPETEYNQKLSCRVTASNTTNPPLVGTSPQVNVGIGPALRATAAPALTGTARPGYRLYCGRGSWTPLPTSVTYQWRVDGRGVAAYNSSVIVPLGWRGHYVSCVVTAKRAAWSNGVAASRIVKVA